MSDFLSRLVARSYGEKPLVRPRIAAAFAQPTQSGERAPAGDILRQGPERLPAMAPLPVGPARAFEKVSHAEQAFEPQMQKPRSPQAALLAPENYRLAKGEIEAEETDKRVRSNVQREIVETESTPKPATKQEVHEPTLVESTKVNGVEIPATLVFQAARSKGEQEDGSRSGDVTVATTSAMPLAAPALRPASRNSEPRFENPRKKEPSEPAIQLTIGKIEVRATIASPKTIERKMPTGAMSLEEYQRLRNRRSAG